MDNIAASARDVCKPCSQPELEANARPSRGKVVCIILRECRKDGLREACSICEACAFLPDASESDPLSGMRGQFVPESESDTYCPAEAAITPVPGMIPFLRASAQPLGLHLRRDRLAVAGRDHRAFGGVAVICRDAIDLSVAACQ